MNNFGWSPNPIGVKQVLASLDHPGILRAAAPNWMGDGLEGDLMPYLAYYETEDDWGGSLEPPYLPQPGNDCTAEALARVNDLLQIISSLTDNYTFHRTCIETSYAFGLFKAGMRGDNGCYGAAMAKGAKEIGFLSYRDLPAPQEVSKSRLTEFANDPQSVVTKYSEQAIPIGEIVLIKSWEEYCALIANQGLATVASTVGYDSPRDSRGICQRRGYWPHQMAAAGVIRSDGVETAVILQSWGPNTPKGPVPFKLPTFAFRVLKTDFQSQLAAGDTWGFRVPANFEPTPLPDKYTNAGWAA